MAVIPSAILDSIAGICVAHDPDDGSRDSPLGTGFFLHHLLGPETDAGHQARGLLVTNKHVAEAADFLAVRFNPSGLPPTRIVLPRQFDDGNPVWVGHPDPDVDLAVTGVVHGRLNQLGALADRLRGLTDQQAFRVDNLKAMGASEGDQVLVLGYPLGIMPFPSAMPIARSGIIARIRDAMAGDSRTFYIDSQIFPGNSGGPVLLIPQSHAVKGTSLISEGGLIGVVKAVARHRINPPVPATAGGGTAPDLWETAGLGVVETVDALLETIEAYETKYPSL